MRPFLSFFSLSLLLLGLSWPVSSAVGVRQYQPRFYPFDRGESVRYKASWNGIPVASAEIETRSIWIAGKKFYRVKIRAKTWKVVDLIWKMRDSLESIFDAQTFSPHRFIFSQKENRRRTETRVSFDQQTKKVMVHRQKGKKIKQFEFVSDETFDPISAVYLLRSLDVKIGDRLEMNLFGGHNHYRLVLHVVEQERIHLAVGKFDAFKIDAQLIKQTPLTDDRKNHRQKVRRGSLWISSDPKRILLKASSKVWIGSVYLELMDIQAPAGDPS